MGDIVNLRRARKDRKRQEAGKDAEANRLSFGRTKSERKLTNAQNALSERRIAAHQLGRDDAASVPVNPSDEDPGA